MIKLTVLNRRCDEAMKRSKERCNTPDHKQWQCRKNCENCVCCIETVMGGYGSIHERHVRFDK